MAYGMCRFAFFVALISLCASCGRKQIAQPYTSFSQSPETDSLFQGRDGSGETSPKKSQKKTTDQKTVSEERVQQNNFLANLELARRIDVPVPVNYSLVFSKKDEGSDSSFVSYQGNLPADKLRDFYLREMERLGWNIIDFSNDNEGLLVCDNVIKYCSVSIRQDDQTDATNIYLFVRPKKKKQQTDLQNIDLNQHMAPSSPIVGV